MKLQMCFRFSLVYIRCAILFASTMEYNTVLKVDDENTNRYWKFFKKHPDFQVTDKLDETGEMRFLSGKGDDRVNVKISDKLNEIGAVFIPVDKCSRYCIKGNLDKNQNNFQYINLFWTANNTNTTDQYLSTDYFQLLSKSDEDSNNIPKNCQIYLDLDCNLTEIGTAPSYVKNEFHSDTENRKFYDDDPKRFIQHHAKNWIKIAEEYNLREQTETKFILDITYPRIVIIIDGKLSVASLRIPTETTASRHGTVMSWTRRNSTEGINIDTRKAPSGEWCLKLTGEDNSKYNVSVIGFMNEENNDEENLFLPRQLIAGNFNRIQISFNNFDAKTSDNTSSVDKNLFIHPIKVINAKSDEMKKQRYSFINTKLMHNGRALQERSLRDHFQHNARNEKENTEDNASASLISSSSEYNLENFVEYVTFINNNTNVIASVENSYTKPEKTTQSVEGQQILFPKTSIGAIETFDIKARMPIKSKNDVSMKMIEALDNRELSEELVNYDNQDSIEEKRMLIEVNRNSNLLVTPGTLHKIVFDVKNNCILPVRYAFRVKSSPFRLYSVQPSYAWIYPGQLSNVGVDLIVPDNATPDTVNTVTLSILGTEIKEKSVYLYVKGSLSKLTDDVKPTIEYSFNNNCARKLEKNQCYKSRWSIDVKIQDYDSGLKTVISSPNDIFSQVEFISGTRSPITFYYSATCCEKIAKITAIDLLNNYNTITVDVTAWNNLSDAEIAAISVGALFALVLVILIIILIIYCVRKRKSHDLPYTQRYGSRPPTHSERTNL